MNCPLEAQMPNWMTNLFWLYWEKKKKKKIAQTDPSDFEPGTPWIIRPAPYPFGHAPLITLRWKLTNEIQEHQT